VGSKIASSAGTAVELFGGLLLAGVAALYGCWRVIKRRARRDVSRYRELIGGRDA
jgi:hypothetical protein